MDQNILLLINLSEQLIKGTFEYTLNRLINNNMNLKIFDCKYNNDLTSASGIEPRILLKIILYYYSVKIIN